MSKIAYDNDNWIYWRNPGPRFLGYPLAFQPEDIVEVEFRSGETYSGTVNSFRWSHIGMGGDIVRFRKAW